LNQIPITFPWITISVRIIQIHLTHHKIAYQIPKSGHVTLKVYDTIGKEVATLVNADKTAGNYVVISMDWDYRVEYIFTQFNQAHFIRLRKMILLSNSGKWDPEKSGSL